MAQIKGKLTATEASAEKPSKTRGNVDLTGMAKVYEIKGNGVTLDMTHTSAQAIKVCKECFTPAVVFEITTQSGMKKEIFRNSMAEHAQSTGM